MKRSIRHLPPEKQYELNKLVSYVVESRPVEMIILFGSYARGDWVEDKYIENGTTFEYKSDYDLLFVVDSEEKAHRYKAAKKLKQKLLKKVKLNTSVNVIYHGIDYLNAELEEGSYFFTDILKEGIRLYHSKRFVLSKPRPLSLENRLKKAELYFEKWLQSADEFFKHFKYALKDHSYSMAAFNLHQSAERYYMTTLLVYTDYKPKTHDLSGLHVRTCKQNNRFKAIFPQQSEEEIRMFTLLKKAYIDSRYKIGYEIKKEELEYLSGRVKQLRDLTEEVCKEKIGQMKQA